MIWVLGVAHAVELELPAGQPVAAWDEAIEHASLADRPGQLAVVPGDPWQLVVTTPSGSTRSVAIDEPASQDDREAVAALAASLLTPLSVALPTPPEPEPEVVAVAPAPPVEPPPEPEPVVEPEPVLVPPPPEPVVPDPHLWDAFATVAVRPRQLPSVELGGRRWIGPERGPRLGLEAAVAPWTRVTSRSGLGAGLTEARVGAGVGLPLGRVELALGVSLSARQYRPDDWTPTWVAVPSVSAGVGFRLRPSLSLHVAATGDLRLVRLGTEDGPDDTVVPGTGVFGVTWHVK